MNENETVFVIVFCVCYSMQIGIAILMITTKVDSLIKTKRDFWIFLIPCFWIYSIIQIFVDSYNDLD